MKSFYPRLLLGALIFIVQPGIFHICTTLPHSNGFEMLFASDIGSPTQSISAINDILVNDDNQKAGHHASVKTASDTSGNQIIVWEDYRNGHPDIYMQRLDTFPYRNERVNDDHGMFDQYNPNLATSKSGRFAIVWTDYRGVGSCLFLQNYDANGQKYGSNHQLTDVRQGIGVSYPSIAEDSLASAIVTWGENRTDDDGDIYYQKVSKDGLIQISRTKVNTDATSQVQSEPQIAVSRNGDFIIVWDDFRNGNYDIYMQAFRRDGTPKGTNKRVNDDIGSAEQYGTDITINDEGYVLITWIDYRNNTQGESIYAQCYSPDLQSMGANQKVNDSDFQYEYDVKPLAFIDYWGMFQIGFKQNGRFYFQVLDKQGNKISKNQVTDQNFQFNAYEGPIAAIGKLNSFDLIWVAMEGNICRQKFNSFYRMDGFQQEVNDDANSAEQSDPSIASDASDHFAITWKDFRNNLNSPDIYMKTYSLKGQASIKNIKVNDVSLDVIGVSHKVTMDRSGHSVVTWTNSPYENGDIYLQRFAINGERIGVNEKVNDDIGKSSQSWPCIAADSIGNFIVAWRDRRNNNERDIYMQRYSFSGQKIGVNNLVNDDGKAASQAYPAAAMDDQGNAIITWDDYRNGNGDIYYQKYDKSGNKIGKNNLVNQDFTATYQGASAVAIDNDGHIVICWIDSRNGNNDIYLQRLTFAGDGLQGINQQVNDDATGLPQGKPSVTIGENGDFIIVWEDYRNGIGNPDVFAQKFFADGRKYGTNHRLVKDGEELAPQATTASEKIILTWQDNRRRAGWDIFYKTTDWTWGGISKNKPTARIAALPSQITLGDSIIIDGSSSFDLDRDSLEYCWNYSSPLLDFRGAGRISWSEQDTVAGYFRYPRAATTVYKPWRAGDHNLSLIVNDGSLADTTFTNFSVIPFLRNLQIGHNQNINDLPIHPSYYGYSDFKYFNNQLWLNVGLNSFVILHPEISSAPFWSVDLIGAGLRDFYVNDSLLIGFDSFHRILFFKIGTSQSFSPFSTIQLGQLNGKCLYVADKYLFISFGIDGLQIYDFSDPRSPKMTTWFKNSMNWENFTIKNQVLYCLSTKSQSLLLLDIKNISTPNLLKEFILPARCSKIKQLDGSFYMFGSDTLLIYNLDNPDMPNLLGKIVADKYLNPDNYIVDVWNDQNRIAIATITGFNILDITDIDNPVSVAEFISGYPTKTIYLKGDNLISVQWNWLGNKGYYEGILDFKFSNTSVEMRNGNPNVYTLLQNYPNPFNASTTIRFTTMERCKTRLRVFDCIGHEVAKLVDEMKEQGEYAIHWSPMNLPSGIYFYQIELESSEWQSAVSRKSTKKMILLK